MFFLIMQKKCPRIGSRYTIMNFINIILKYINNCFLFFVPILIFNILFFKKLPSHYLMNISHPIITAETITRIITIAFSTIMVINIQKKTGKIGLMIYIIGAIIYFTSYFIEIYAPNTLFSRNKIFILAPYWTSVICTAVRSNNGKNKKLVFRSFL